MDAENLLFESKSFDCLFCGFCLFFLPDIFQALSEFKRVLKPTGRLVVSVWGDRSALDLWLHECILRRGVTQKLAVHNLYSEQNLYLDEGKLRQAGS